MNDARLDNLIRLAREAEDFERDAFDAAPSASGTGLRLTHAGPEEREALLRAMQPESVRAALEQRSTGSNSWKFRTALGVAACLAIGWFLYPAAKVTTTIPAPATPRTTGTLASAASRTESPVRFRPSLAVMRTWSTEPRLVSTAADLPTGNEQGCVIVAIFKDSAGGCPCIHIQPHTLADGRSLDDLAPEELLDVRLKGSCGATGDSLLLVAVQGPGNMLPHTAAEAEALADCVGDAPRVCDGSPGCMANLARGCLPPSVKVLAQSVQMASR
jgi:hypothetical protein